MTSPRRTPRARRAIRKHCSLRMLADMTSEPYRLRQSLMHGYESERASNRQRKVLKLLGVAFGDDLSISAASWEITRLFEDPANEDRWSRYVFRTQDFDVDSDELAPFDEDELANVQLPEGWDRTEAVTRFRSELVKAEMSDGSPFDIPMPRIKFDGAEFVFTGRFEFGSRTACADAVEQRGGSHAKRVSRSSSYLVVGTLGSPVWKNRNYGTKIEDAIILRREGGRLSIVSEQHWRQAL